MLKKENKNSLHLFRKEVTKCILMIVMFVTLFIPIYIQSYNVVRNNLKEKLQRNILFGMELIENELDLQDMIAEKLISSADYKRLCKSSGIKDPREIIVLNNVKDYYEDLCSGLFIQDKVITLFRNNDIMLEKGRATSNAEWFYNSMWRFNDLTYDQVKQKLFEKHYYGEFSTELGFMVSDKERVKVVYIKTVSANFSLGDSVMISIFDQNEIIKKCGLEEIAEIGNIKFCTWDGQEIFALENTDRVSMKMNYKVQSKDINIEVEIPGSYVLGKMKNVIDIFLFYIVVAILIVAVVIVIVTYRHWRFVTEIADVFNGMSLEACKIDYKFIKKYKDRVTEQKNKAAKLLSTGIFYNILLHDMSEEDIKLLNQTDMKDIDEYCLLMISNDSCGNDWVERVYCCLNKGRIHVIQHVKIDTYTAVFLIDWVVSNTADLKKLVCDMIYNNDMKLKVVISGVKTDLREARETCIKMRNLLSYIVNSTFLVLDELEMGVDYGNYLNFDSLKQLYEYIMDGNTRLAVRHVYGEWHCLVENPVVTDEISKLFYWQYCVLVQVKGELGYEGALPVLEREKNIILIEQSIIQVVEQMSELAISRKKDNNCREDQIIKYINENCCNSQFYMKDIVDKFSLSERTISEIVKTKTGKRYSDYIGEKRMKRVEYLLSTTDISINDIAEISGFESSNTLYKAFKRTYGISPSSYRDNINDSIK